MAFTSPDNQFTLPSHHGAIMQARRQTGHAGHCETGAQMQVTEETVRPLTRGPVCGRHITEAQALLRAEHHGRTYLFCSEHCRMLFALRPESFAVDKA
jgi:YHS domain-containing protein